MSVDEVAESLEEYASSRANFHDLSDEQRTEIATWLVRARSHATNSGDTDYGDPDAWDLIRKKGSYAYACGEAGLDLEEARHIWWNYVYDSPAPAARENLI